MKPLIDTHQHLIYPDVAGYGWTDDIPALAKKGFSLEDYKELADLQAVGATLFMEAGVDDTDYRKEARFVAELAQNPSSGIVGLIASCRPESDEGFDSWLDECESMNVVGFRRILHVMPDDLSKTEIFRNNVRKIGSRGLVFDMCFLAAQLPIAIELAKSCDNTNLVLNHCGVPDIAGGGLDPWRQHISDLAMLPHVSCKLSGILAYCTAGGSSFEAVKPYADHVFERFGADRIVWGSDWPVVNLAKGLPDWLEVTGKILAGMSESEKSQVAQENAKRIYKLNI